MSTCRERLIFFLFVACFLAVPTSGDEVLLDTGIKVKGKVISRNREKVVVLVGKKRMEFKSEEVVSLTIIPPKEFKQGEEALKCGDIRAAIGYFRTIAEKERGLFAEDALERLVQCYARLGQLDEAIEKYLTMVKLFPETGYAGHFPWHMSVSTTPRISSKWDGTAGKLVRIIQIWLSVCRNEVSDARAELKPFLGTEANGATYEAAYIVLLRWMFETGMFDELTSMKPKLLESHGKTLAAWGNYWRGRAYLKKGDGAHAALSFLRVVELYPGYDVLAGDSLFMVANYFENNNKRQKALAAYREVYQRFPVCMLSDTARKRAGG